MCAKFRWSCTIIGQQQPFSYLIEKEISLYIAIHQCPLCYLHQNISMYNSTQKFLCAHKSISNSSLFNEAIAISGVTYKILLKDSDVADVMMLSSLCTVVFNTIRWFSQRRIDPFIVFSCNCILALHIWDSDVRILSCFSCNVFTFLSIYSTICFFLFGEKTCTVWLHWWNAHL